MKEKPAEIIALFYKKKIKIKKKLLTETDLKEIMHAKRKKKSDREIFLKNLCMQYSFIVFRLSRFCKKKYIYNLFIP